MNKKSLYFNPFFLFFSKIVRTLSFFNLSYKFIHNNRYEQIHDEESCDKNVYDENQWNCHVVILFHDHVFSDCINGIEQDIRPHF